MDLTILIDNIQKKVVLLAQRLEKSQAINKELREEVRLLDTQLNEYTNLIGDLEMEMVELKKESDKKKK